MLFRSLATIIGELKANRHTRRAVLAMWDGGCIDPVDARNGVRGDLHRAIAGSADVPCNTHVYFDTVGGRLNMMVCCRSNDIIWGAYGANAVHFSFLLEYVSQMTGLSIGVYRQLSNNYHLYTDIVPPERIMPMARDVEMTDFYAEQLAGHPSLRVERKFEICTVPLVTDPDTFDADLLQWFDESCEDPINQHFLYKVASPMRRAYALFKAGEYDVAVAEAKTIAADDWQKAAVEWLQRRQGRAAERKIENATA